MTRNSQFAERPYGWVIVAVATLCMAAGFGANVTVSVFIGPFEQEFGWSRAHISFAYTALTAGAAIGGIFWGSLSDQDRRQNHCFCGRFFDFGSACPAKPAERSLGDICALFLYRLRRFRLFVHAAFGVGRIVVR